MFDKVVFHRFESLGGKSSAKKMRKANKEAAKATAAAAAAAAATAMDEVWAINYPTINHPHHPIAIKSL